MTRLLIAVIVLGTMMARAQSVETLERFGQRMELLERQSAELQEQIRMLRAELETVKRSEQEASSPAARVEALEEQVQLQEGRLAEQDQIKIQGTHRTPVRLTGLVLFNAFYNGHNGGPNFDYPVLAQRTPGPILAGATLVQSVVGLEFQAPDAVLGGHFRGSFLLDLASGEGTPTNSQMRLRTASIEGQWKTWGFLVGQEKPIFVPRNPDSLAQVRVGPLGTTGNIYRWRPQVRFEKRLKLGSAQQLRARIGVSQTAETFGSYPPELVASLERTRPALEGHFQFTRRIDDFRRVEIASGFHWSVTHVAGLSIPATVFSLDWFCNPIRRVEFTGAAFTGENMAKLGGLTSQRGFLIVTPRPGQILANPVHSRGGWAQITWLATSRLTFNLFSGQQNWNNRDLQPLGTSKNLMSGANLFYRMAPNVIVGAEASQVRTWFMTGQRPLNNHYDLYVGYLF